MSPEVSVFCLIEIPIVIVQGLAFLSLLPCTQQLREKLRRKDLYTKVFRMALPYSGQLQGQIAKDLQFLYRHGSDLLLFALSHPRGRVDFGYRITWSW